MCESSKFTKSWLTEIQILKLAICLQILIIFKFKSSIVFKLTENRSGKLRYNQPNSAFWGWLSKESQPQNPVFRNNPESFTHVHGQDLLDLLYIALGQTDWLTKRQMDKAATICCQLREHYKIYRLSFTENTSWITQKIYDFQHHNKTWHTGRKETSRNIQMKLHNKVMSIFKTRKSRKLVISCYI